MYGPNLSETQTYNTTNLMLAQIIQFPGLGHPICTWVRTCSKLSQQISVKEDQGIVIVCDGE